MLKLKSSSKSSRDLIKKQQILRSHEVFFVSRRYISVERLWNFLPAWPSKASLQVSCLTGEVQRLMDSNEQLKKAWHCFW